jgi:hypothetical protein
MPVFTSETPRGRKVKIEAADQATAIRGAERWDLQDHATSEAKRLGVDPGLVIAVGEQESGWNPGATSPKGARGAMQLMPATARELGVNPDDPYENITGGVTYLRRQLDTFGDERKALAAYNAGPGAVQQYGGVPPFRETQAYVEAITSGRGGEVAEAEMTAGPVPRTPPPGVLPPPMGQATPVRTNSVNPAEVAALATRPSFGLGVQKGAFTSVDNVYSRAGYNPPSAIPPSPPQWRTREGRCGASCPRGWWASLTTRKPTMTNRDARAAPQARWASSSAMWLAHRGFRAARLFKRG